MNNTRRIDSTLPAPTAKQRRRMVSFGQRLVAEALGLCPRCANVPLVRHDCDTCNGLGKVPVAR